MFISKYLQVIDYDDEYKAIWHSYFGRPMIFPADLAQKLLRIARMNNHEVKSFSALFGADYESNQEKIDEINSLREAHILIESEESELLDIQSIFSKHNLPVRNKVKYLSLIMSEECNFRCKYCIHFANSKHQYNPEKFMSTEIAKESIDQYLEVVKDNKLELAYINFGGGEPLLNWKTLSELLDYIESCKAKYDFPITLGINTNMSLMTPEIAEKLIQHDVFVAASLDGLKKGNDSVRLSKNLAGTYEEIITGFRIMKEAGRPLSSFAMTVTEENFEDIKEGLIDWASSLGMEEVRIDIDIVGMVNIPIETIVDKLSTIRKYARSKNINLIGFWSRAAENLGLEPETEDIGFCGGERGNSVCVAPNGQVFPCGYSNYTLGTFDQIKNIHKQPAYAQLLANRQLSNHMDCESCSIAGFCHGGCLITKEANETNDKMLRMCELYRRMTYEIIRESPTTA